MSSPIERPLNLLVVEDSEDDAKLVLRLLERGGLDVRHERVESAAAMQAALARGAWDAVLSDYNMPGFTGLDALQLLQGSGLDIPFIVVSGTIGEARAVELMKAGASDYLLKRNMTRLAPTLMRELKEAANRAAKREAERTLAASERRLRVIVAAEPECVKLVAADGRLLEMNPAGLAMLEADSLEAARARPLLEFILPEYRAAFVALHQRVMRGESGTLEFEVTGLRGGRRRLETHAVPLPGEGGATALLGITRDITERQRAQEALRASEERFRSLSALSADWYWEQDENFRFVASSSRDKPRPEEAADIGRTRWESAGADPKEPKWAAHRALLEQHRPFRDFEYGRASRDGLWRLVSVSGEPVFDAKGGFRGYRGVGRDLTERQRAHEAVLRERNFNDTAIDSLPGLFYLLDAEGRFLRWNRNFARLSGYAPEEIARLRPVDLVPEADRAMVAAKIGRVFQGGEETAETDFRAKDGTCTPHYFTGSLVQIDQKPCLIGMGVDITERRRAEHEARQLRLAMDASTDSIYLTDPAAMRFVYANDTGCRRLGYSREALLEKGPQDVLPGGREQISREYDAVVAAGEPGMTYERRFLRSDGSEEWTELSRRALQVEGRTLIVSIGRDISERKAAEARIRRLNRVHALLSGINALIVRARDRGELFRQSCHIALEHGGFGMAWIGEVDRETLEVAPVAWAGLDEGAAGVKASARADLPQGQGMVGRAIRGKRAVITNDIAADPAAGGGRRAEALRKGMQSIIALPLMVGDEARAVLTLYAPERDFFSGEEVKLLAELAGDISFALEHIEKQEKLDYLAFYDQLTGLANRALLIERINQTIRSAGEAGGKFALAILDIERLRVVNESLGRQAGDALLKQVARRLTAASGPSGAGRIGADQFALVLGQVKGLSQAGRILNATLQACFGEPLMANGSQLRLAAKAGVARFPADGANAETLLDNAEVALRKAKALGERHLFYTPALSERSAGTLTLESQLRQALEKEEFVLHYQPKVDSETRAITGVEALLRWESPEQGLVPPAKFIPLLEETGMILDAGAWALRRAAADHRRWVGQGLQAPRVAVNVSPIQLRQRDFVAAVEQAIIEGIAPTGIDLEITESLIMEDVQGCIEKLEAVRRFGVRIAVDDFGTGYSSLAYLAKLPVQTLKIDRSFIITMIDQPDIMTLVSTVISLAHSLRLKVVAEGVDSEEQAKILRLLRCDEMQGYLFSKPLTFEALTALLQKKGPGSNQRT